MRVTYILDEDFINYKKPSMFIGTIQCSKNCPKCQNQILKDSEILDILDTSLCERYLNNHLTRAIVFGGLEPFEQFDELIHFIDILRNKYKCDDDIVIYTGHYMSEIGEELDILTNYNNIIIKFGPYIEGRDPIFDNVLGITLASNNQYGIRLTGMVRVNAHFISCHKWIFKDKFTKE